MEYIDLSIQRIHPGVYQSDRLDILLSVTVIVASILAVVAGTADYLENFDKLDTMYSADSAVFSGPAAAAAVVVAVLLLVSIVRLRSLGCLALGSVSRINIHLSFEQLHPQKHNLLNFCLECDLAFVLRM